MTRQLFDNNLVARLVSDIADLTTVFDLALISGAWPALLDAGDYFLLTFSDANGDFEIMRVTGIAGDTMTVLRGEEQTTRRPWLAAGTIVSSRITAATLTGFVKDDEDNRFTGVQTFGAFTIFEAPIEAAGGLIVGNTEISDGLIEDPEQLELFSPALRLNGIGWPADPRLVEGQNLGVVGQQVVGKNFNFYLGALPYPPTALPNGDPIPVGALYFDLNARVMRVWDGSGWISAAQAPAPAAVATLVYRATDGQQDILLSTPDLLDQTFVLRNGEPFNGVDVHVNGLRLVQDDGTGTVGEFTVDNIGNRIVFDPWLAEDDMVQIDVLTPNALLAPGTVNIVPILDLNVDWSDPLQPPGMIDGTRTTFTLYYVDENLNVTIAVLASNQELALFVNDSRLRPGADYSVFGSELTFTTAPQPTDEVWALWYQPAGSGAGGGVAPPTPPLDQQNAIYQWTPGFGRPRWIDGRGYTRAVATLADRQALRPNIDIAKGSLVLQADTADLWYFDGAAWGRYLDAGTF
jgi:hypothetical protein